MSIPLTDLAAVLTPVAISTTAIVCTWIRQRGTTATEREKTRRAEIAAAAQVLLGRSPSTSPGAPRPPNPSPDPGSPPPGPGPAASSISADTPSSNNCGR